MMWRKQMVRIMGKLGTYTRRGFLAAGGLIGGGLVLGIAVAPNRLGIKGDRQAITTWLKITPDNRVTVLVPHCDIGQGSQTALAMMLAEELDADWSLVSAQEAPAIPAYANEYLVRGFVLGFIPPAVLPRSMDDVSLGIADLVGLQLTGGSASVRMTGEMGMRTAGAAARIMLVQAAATRWDVAPGDCTTSLSIVRHGASGRSFTYGDLAADAAQLSPPSDPALKPYAAWRIVGTSPPRADIPEKVDGSAKYGIDIVLPDMLYATVTAAPVFGGKLTSVDTALAEKMPGVHSVVRLDNAVAVIAEGYWQALQAVRALKPVFSDGGHGTVSSAGILADQRALLAAGAGSTDVKQGDAAGSLAAVAKTITAEYSVPYLAHATMEPPNATIHIADGKCEIWTGVQDPLNARAVAAKAAGLGRENVTLHNCRVGGGYGRKLPFVFDFIEQATLIAKAASPRPVKMIWSREEDIQHDYYRPTALIRFQGGLNAAGVPVAWRAHYTASADENAAHIPYGIGNVLITKSKFANHVRTGAWRSVDHSQHGFFSESFVDELALAAGKDPFEFRRDLLPAGSRYRAVLELCADKAGWGNPLPAGTGRGIALTEAFGSIVAQAAEVTVSPAGAVKVNRVTAVVDCGDLVHPDTATSQIEGGIMFGLAAALYGEITIDKGAVAQDNFAAYQVAKMADTPEIAVHYIASHAPRGGIGEVGVPPIAPAVANAIHAACGVRIRTLPIRSITLPAAAEHASAL
jgi:isoquinoline 1-oxidoreductase subunit beta